MDSALQQQLDRNYRYQRYIYDRTRAYYLLGRDDLIEQLAPPHGARVLEIGCGTARNLVMAATLFPHARLFGIDLSEKMLDTASQNLSRAGLSSHVQLAHGDATTFNSSALFGCGQFDRVVFSYALSMIPRWRLAIEHAANLLAPGGSLHIVDFGRGEGLPGFANAALREWLARFHVTPRDSLETILRDIAIQRKIDLKFTSRYRGYSVHAMLTSPIA